MRLDIQTEAEKLAARINGTDKHAGRRYVGSERLVVYWAGVFATYSMGTHAAAYMLKHRACRCVGTYTPGVTAEQIAEDLAEVMA